MDTPNPVVGLPIFYATTNASSGLCKSHCTFILEEKYEWIVNSTWTLIDGNPLRLMYS